MMPRAMSLATSTSRTAKPLLSTAKETLSILPFLPFHLDQHQQDALSIIRQGPGTREASWEIADKIRDSMSGITAWSGGRGSRADDQRAGGRNLDNQILMSGLVTRLTAHIPVSLEIGGYKSTFETVQAYAAENRLESRAVWALHHAERRARFQIGRGLLQAACALHEHGLLREAEPFWGDGRNSAERILLRDAVFASEDLTIEEMVRILISAPYKVAERFGDPIPFWLDEDAIDDRTPLIFVHCAGITDDLKGRREVVLEAVDFGCIETLSACFRAASHRDSAMMRDAQEMLFAARRKRSPGRLR